MGAQTPALCVFIMSLLLLTTQEERVVTPRYPRRLNSDVVTIRSPTFANPSNSTVKEGCGNTNAPKRPHSEQPRGPKSDVTGSMYHTTVYNNTVDEGGGSNTTAPYPHSEQPHGPKSGVTGSMCPTIVPNDTVGEGGGSNTTAPYPHSGWIYKWGLYLLIGFGVSLCLSIRVGLHHWK